MATKWCLMMGQPCNFIALNQTVRSYKNLKLMRTLLSWILFSHQKNTKTKLKTLIRFNKHKLNINRKSTGKKKAIGKTTTKALTTKKTSSMRVWTRRIITTFRMPSPNSSTKKE